MPRVQLTLFDVMVMVVFAAVVSALYAYLEHAPAPPANHVHHAAIAVYVAVLCMSALAARTARLEWRPFWTGVALFGIVYLIVGLKLAWGTIDFLESASLVFRCKIALPLGILCGMATQWLAVSPVSKDESAR
jgi:hypothetical protein